MEIEKQGGRLNMGDLEYLEVDVLEHTKINVSLEVEKQIMGDERIVREK